MKCEGRKVKGDETNMGHAEKTDKTESRSTLQEEGEGDD